MPKNGYGFIYKYTSPSGSSYIGQTTTSLKQRAGHGGKNYRNCSLFYKAILKYGLDNFEVEILAEVKKEKLDEEEKKYIQIFNTLQPHGYNLTEGGQNGPKKETKKVYQYSSSTGELIKEWGSTLEISKYFKANCQVFQACLENKVFTQYGFCWSYLKMERFPINERIVNPTSKSVKMYSLDGKLQKEFNSIAKAAEEVGGDRSSIKRCCRHELSSHCGHKWECSEVLAEKKYNNTAKKVLQINPKTEEVVHCFPSISSAARSLGKETSLIRRVLNRDNNTAYGYKWKTAQGSTTTNL